MFYKSNSSQILLTSCSPEATSDLDEKTAGEREHGEQAEANGQTRDDTSDFLQKPEESEKAFAARILERVYNKDIETLLSMEARIHFVAEMLPPKPLCQ